MMEEYRIRDEFIKLGQALKAAGLTDSGAAAKEAVQTGKVLVNGVVELQRGKKLYEGDIVTYQEKQLKITK